MQGKPFLIGPHVIDECDRKGDEMLSEILTSLPHDRVKMALAEVAIPFLIVEPFDEANRDGCAMCPARKRRDDANKPAKYIRPAHDARDSAHILCLLYAVHAPHGFGHSVKRGAQNVAKQNVGHCTSLLSHDMG